MGRLCQTAICRTRTGAGLRRPLYPPRGHLQQPSAGHRSRSGEFPMERLSRPRPAEIDDALRRGIHSPISPPRSARWISAHSLLWLSWQPLPARKARAMPPITGDGHSGRSPFGVTVTRGLPGPARKTHRIFVARVSDLPPWPHDDS